MWLSFGDLSQVSPILTLNTQVKERAINVSSAYMTASLYIGAGIPSCVAAVDSAAVRLLIAFY